MAAIVSVVIWSRPPLRCILRLSPQGYPGPLTRVVSLRLKANFRAKCAVPTVCRRTVVVPPCFVANFLMAALGKAMFLLFGQLIHFQTFCLSGIPTARCPCPMRRQFVSFAPQLAVGFVGTLLTRRSFRIVLRIRLLPFVFALWRCCCCVGQNASSLLAKGDVLC